MANVIVATSDQHADNAPDGIKVAQLEFFEWLRGRSEVRWVFSVGDLWSLTLESSVKSVVESEHCGRMRDVLRRLSESKRVVLVDGNHDPYSTLPVADRRRFMEWLAAPRIEFPGPVFNQQIPGYPAVHFEHGHRFDPTHDMWVAITETLRGILGPAAAERLFKWAIAFFYRGGQGPTPVQVRAEDPTPDKDAYRYLVELMHERMWKWTLGNENACGLVATGHTHFDEYRHKELKSRSYVNCGAFDGWGNTYVEVSSGATRLRRWPDAA
ncbi:hypothetical protein FJY71_07495 [candidate division WOR-3 bacterium]|nr:hypothetical protein [candidate division WOR-3 bacterium]